MKRFTLALLLSLGTVTLFSESAEAQRFRRPLAGCCETCNHAHADCTCTLDPPPVAAPAPVAVPVPVMETRVRPVIQTQLQARQVTTYRDVAETHYRQQTVVENVPVTTFKNVTVDEGGYQMVWVPKPVTKQVAQTSIQQQAKTVAVPYQVTKRIPQVTTQLVPVQTVHHVTQTVPVYTAAVPAQIAAPSCNVCNHRAASANLNYYTTPMAYSAPPMVASFPTIGTTSAAHAYQTMPAISAPISPMVLSPAQSPADTTTEEWQTIPPRSRTDNRSSNTITPRSKQVPSPSDEAQQPQRKTSFVPAPSAAIVWNTRRETR